MMEQPYMTSGRLATVDEVQSWLPKIEKEKVSEVARKNITKQFLDAKGDISKIDPKLMLKRHYFLLRQVPLYNQKKTYRRMLSLIAWFYLPNEVVEKRKKVKKSVSKETGKDTEVISSSPKTPERIQ